MIFIRKCLDFIFTREELAALDSIIPPFSRKKNENQPIEVSHHQHQNQNQLLIINRFSLEPGNTLTAKVIRCHKSALKSTLVTKWSNQEFGSTLTRANLLSKTTIAVVPTSGERITLRLAPTKRKCNHLPSCQRSLKFSRHPTVKTTR